MATNTKWAECVPEQEPLLQRWRVRVQRWDWSQRAQRTKSAAANQIHYSVFISFQKGNKLELLLRWNNKWISQSCFSKQEDIMGDLLYQLPWHGLYASQPGTGDKFFFMNVHTLSVSPGQVGVGHIGSAWDSAPALKEQMGRVQIQIKHVGVFKVGTQGFQGV